MSLPEGSAVVGFIIDNEAPETTGTARRQINSITRHFDSKK